MAKRGYHHGNLRQALVDAALDLISERGPMGFTLSEAAKAAGVTPAAVYRHFEGREEAVALNKLALTDFPAAESGWQAEFTDAVAQLEKQTRAQRLMDLMQLQSERGLQPDERDELRAMLEERGRE